jgi:hypothetical protein
MSGPAYSNPAIAAVVQNQQLERLNFASGLRQDPAGYSAYQQQRIGQIVNDITGRKQSAFQKAQIDLGRYMDMHHNVNFYKTRSADIDTITGAMLQNNNNLMGNIVHDKDLSKRQFEINEWYNYNKLETLFYLQVVFMSSMAASIVMYLSKRGTISGGVAVIIYSLLALTVLVVGAYRYFFTNNTRDVKLWHRRYFASTPPAPTPAKECDSDLNKSYCDELESAFAAADKVSGCVGNIYSNAERNLSEANKTAIDEVAMMQSGANPLGRAASLLSREAKSLGNTVCSGTY